MTVMRKKLSCIICSILLAFSLTACGKDWKEEIVTYVNDNTDMLLSVCEKWCEEGKKDIADLDGTGLPPEVDISGGTDFILFEFYAEGLMTATVQGGFYYSREDTPYNNYGIMGLSDEITATEENRWEWHEEGGDNYYITEKISEHLYYYCEGW